MKLDFKGGIRPKFIVLLIIILTMMYMVLYRAVLVRKYCGQFSTYCFVAFDCEAEDYCINMGCKVHKEAISDDPNIQGDEGYELMCVQRSDKLYLGKY